ncbi:Gp19/Gp15/Gp42 family protein [Corynebacterium sp. P6129]|uniref:Gp19/Gp15/Gp42 family protein n=1 Tax=Corynebacterium antarcticum TaxID=2800405 RepID=UPI002260A798|nr:Gp19/Gp15/Gp42 family protein [Corynebacterium antarcticum]MCX7491474.1 Gp19/Gp15/Gp42 family protein [Corynebacterium antarcticum]
MPVTLGDIKARLADGIEPDAETRVEILIADAESRIEEEFQRAGMDLDAQLVSRPWLASTVRRVTIEMVARAVVLAGRAGIKMLKSSSGPFSDLVEYEAGASGLSAFAGVTLTDEQRQELGLPTGGLPMGRFPPPSRWPERWLND